ncbi:ExbD/TolR family protein [Oxalobacteraceae bacterium CAVE-383]|nr:ExbD/TolR family protein [Oxalobacteraceae bacterium CAVE-383]
MSGSTMRGGRTRKFKAEINVVPYIDVMLVLLVIFMVAAPLTNPSVINLPTAGKSTLPPTAYIDIALKPDARATIALKGPAAGKVDSAADRGDLTRKLQSLHDENPELPVMISADKDIKYDDVVQIISSAKKLGVTRVGLATK